MINENLITKAINIVTNRQESRGIPTNFNALHSHAVSWQEHVNIQDPKTLATAIMTGHYDPNLTAQDLHLLTDVYFGEEGIRNRNYHIHEIEEALEW